MTRTKLESSLAIDGGPRVKEDPFGTGQRYGDAELEQLRQALEQQTLFYTDGEKVSNLCKRAAARLGVRHATAVSSGTAAVHSALSAAGVRPGAVSERYRQMLRLSCRPMATNRSQAWGEPVWPGRFRKNRSGSMIRVELWVQLPHDGASGGLVGTLVTRLPWSAGNRRHSGRLSEWTLRRLRHL